MQDMAFFRDQSIKILMFMLVIAAVTMFPEVAMAAAGGAAGGTRSGTGGVEVFDDVDKTLNAGFTNARQIVYVIGGLGAIGLGVGAFFGQFKWGWFFALIGGMLVIALIVEAVDFLTSNSDEGFKSVTFKQAK